MEHAKKMVVVPQELLARLEQRMTQPIGDSQSSSSGGLDAEMYRILNDKTVKDDNIKWKHYQQVLHRFLNVSAANRQPINLPIVDTTTTSLENDEIGSTDEQDKHIINSFPVVYRNEVRPLIHALRRRGVIRWDDDGKVYMDGDEIPNSNIVDILHSIVRVRKITNLPPGWGEVMQTLKDMNIPSTYIGNPTATEFLNRNLAPTASTPQGKSLIPTRLSFPPTPDTTPFVNRTPHRRLRGNTNSSAQSSLSWETFRN